MQGEYYANVTRGRKLSVQVVSPVAQGEGLAEEEGQQLPVSIAFGVAVRPNGRLAKVSRRQRIQTPSLCISLCFELAWHRMVLQQHSPRNH